jgi:hypothetical protein
VADIATIQKRIEQLEKLHEEVRIAKEMLKGELENDLTYLEVAEEVKAAVQKRKQIKDEILGKGPNQEVVANIKSNAEEMATLNEILSAELMQIYQENQVDEIAGRKFKVNAKLMPKKANYENRDNYGQYASAE